VYLTIFSLKHYSIETFLAREARRTKLATAQLDIRNYARCEWKCMEWIGTDDWERICNEAIRKYAIHRVSQNNQNPFQFIPYIATDSGETIESKRILAVPLFLCLSI